MMRYDREIIISVGTSRKSTSWQPLTLMLSEFYKKLEVPSRSTEKLSEYLALRKSEQDDRKDIGGFVAGALSGPRRKADAVQTRELITLDLDNVPPGGTDDVLKRIQALGCGYCAYSTRKHAPSAPRLRVLFPFDRPATADEYEPVARFIANKIGMELVDPTTFEASRLMYWPSCCSDSQWVFKYVDGPMLSIDGLLKAFDEKFGDWHTVANWPQVPGAENVFRGLATRQTDPLSKAGIVGAFCRTYDILGAMDAFLPGVYIPVESKRYTYSGGSTTGGAVIYDNGMFLYSHHSTDPCNSRLVNAFDMVRLHKFGDRDDAATPNTPANRLPSYTAMCELAVADTKVSRQLAKERAESAISDFGQIADEASEGENFDWTTELELNSKSGDLKATIDNIWIILENDPNLRGKFALNEFAGRGEVLGDLPWSSFKKRRAWSDNDNHGLYWYFEKVYKITGNGKIDGALSLHSDRHKFNDVKDFLLSLHWDGVPRLDALFIDYLGASDSPYVRAVTRKAFTAAVARAMDPGCKYDTMLVLSGPQGIGKSTLLDKMSKGWFNDSIRTFEGKEASELIQGVWLVEISELEAFRSTDVGRIKQFLSLRSDRYRAAYGRHVKEIPRGCIFFGTTNVREYLRDRTGGRRFWPVDTGLTKVTKNVWRDLDNELDQVWAEAFMRWKLGETLHIVGDLEEAAKKEQEAHREVSSLEGVIADFLDRPISKDWATKPLAKRLMFLNGENTGEETGALVRREKICALEIWCEVMLRGCGDMRRTDAAEINDILNSMPGWERSEGSLRFGYCGKQRGFVRKC